MLNLKNSFEQVLEEGEVFDEIVLFSRAIQDVGNNNQGPLGDFGLVRGKRSRSSNLKKLLCRDRCLFLYVLHILVAGCDDNT